MSDWKQEALEIGDMGGTPDEVRALEFAYRAGVAAALTVADRTFNELALSGDEEAADTLFTLMQRLKELSAQRHGEGEP